MAKKVKKAKKAKKNVASPKGAGQKKGAFPKGKKGKAEVQEPFVQDVFPDDPWKVPKP